MRLAALVWAGVVLAACTVEVEGAPCGVPGATTDCPRDQACGNDLRCSARALACAASRCTPHADDVCLGATGDAPGTAAARRCVGADPVCGGWVSERCDDRGLLCARRDLVAQCECPSNPTRQLLVRPDGGSSGALPFASGVASPRACAFRTITAAVSRAAELARTLPTSPVEVRVEGGRYAGASGERFPIVVPGGVALRASAGAVAEIVFDAGGAASVAIELRAGSALQGVALRNGDGGLGARAVEVACGGLEDPVHIVSVAVDGLGSSGAQLGTGLHSAGACSVRADGLEIARAGGTGVVWEPEGVASLALSGGSVTGCAGTGIAARSGLLRLYGARIADNGGRGVDGTAAVPNLGLDIRDSRILRNGDTGLVVFGPEGAYLVRNTIWRNGAATAWGGSSVPSGVSRRAGGIAFVGRMPYRFFWFNGNRIYANSGDQIVVVGPPDLGWRLDPGPCYLTNEIGCFDPTEAGTVSHRGLVTIDASGPGVEVTAAGNWWGTGGPPVGVATYRFPEGGDVMIDPACPPDLRAPLACEAEEPRP